MATDFYTAFSPACFSLLALWLAIIAINARAWLSSEHRHQQQRQAYIVALYFATPGTMSLLALINPLSSFVWRVFFIIVSVLGVAGMLLLGPLPGQATPSSARCERSGGSLDSHRPVSGDRCTSVHPADHASRRGRAADSPGAARRPRRPAADVRRRDASGRDLRRSLTSAPTLARWRGRTIPRNYSETLCFPRLVIPGPAHRTDRPAMRAYTSPSCVENVLICHSEDPGDQVASTRRLSHHAASDSASHMSSTLLGPRPK